MFVDIRPEFQPDGLKPGKIRIIGIYGYLPGACDVIKHDLKQHGNMGIPVFFRRIAVFPQELQDISGEQLTVADDMRGVEDRGMGLAKSRIRAGKMQPIIGIRAIDRRIGVRSIGWNNDNAGFFDIEMFFANLHVGMTFDK